MSIPLRILHLEDLAEDALLVSYELQRSDILFDKKDVSTRQEYVAALNGYHPDIVLSDHSLPSFTSTDALDILRAKGLDVPFILVTATVSEDFAVNVMKNGAADYVLKDRLQRLPSAILNAVDRHKVDREKRDAFYQLNVLFNTIDEVFFSRDVITGKLLQISPACERVYGYKQVDFFNDEQLSKRLISPDDQAMISANLSQLNKGNSVVTQYRILRRDGEERWVETKLFPTLDENRRLIRFDGISRDITEKRKTDELLKQNNLRLKEAAERQLAILNALPPHIALLDAAGNIVAVNESWKTFGELNGLQHANHGIGLNYINIAAQATGMDSKPGSEAAQGIADVMLGRKKEFTMEYPCEASFERRWFQMVVAPLSYESQKGVVIAHINITGRKLSEELLAKSEKQYRRIVETAQEGIILIDKHMKIVFVNQKMADMLGYSTEEMVGEYFYNFKNDGEKQVAIDVFVNRDTSTNLTRETSYLTKAGKEIICSLTLNSIFDSEDLFEGNLAMVTDITKRKADEIALKQSEANLRSVFENTDLNIVLFDENLKILSMNSNTIRESGKVFGRQLNIGSSGFNYFPKERWPVIAGILEKVKHGASVGYETMYDITSGGKEWYEVRWVGVFNEDKKNLGFILTLKNITEKKLAELDHEKITSDLARRVQDLEQFTYIISHNLRAPVANIIGLADLLNLFVYTDDECVATIKALGISVNNLDAVIIDLNTILQTGKQINEKIEEVSFDGILTEISNEIRPLLEKNNAILNADFSRAESIKTIKAYLYSILQNLMVNSIKYRKPDTDPIISISSEVSNNKVTIHFSDNGKGIDLDKYGGHLFGLYKRFDFSVEGKGMGLFMVKMQVEDLGGAVSVKSELGEGTEFTIVLPLSS
jgi:PAS domain S-box-containing protein